MLNRLSLRAASDWPLGVAYVAGYVLLDAFSFVQPLLKLGITPWNPQAGLTVAFLLRYGWRRATWTVAAALIAELVVRGATAPPGLLLVASLAIGAGYGALACALSGRGIARPIGTRRDAAMLLLGGGATALFVAIGYVCVFLAAGALPRADATSAVLRYWVGDVNGIVTLTPLLLAAHGVRTMPAAIRGRVLLCAGQATVLIAALALVFGQPREEDLQFVYVLFVPVAWISLTWGVIGSTAATLAVQLGLMVGVHRGLTEASVAEMQLLLVTLATTALLMGAVVEERARALVHVAKREAEQRALLAGAPDAVVTTDPGGLITSANAAAQRLYDAASGEMVGMRVQDGLGDLALLPAGGRANARLARRAGAVLPVDVAWISLEPPAGPGFLLVIRDVSEREQAQAQLRARDTALARAMRLALAGELATALTHELNQPITALVSYLRAVEILAEPIVDRDPRLGDTLAKASREALRAADVLKRLRDFYRTGSSSLEPVDLAALIDEVLSAYGERAATLGIEMTRNLSGISTATADAIQLQMVLHNLVGNAIDALATVDTPRRIRVLADGTHPVRLTVEDTGPGIGPDVGAELFEPFVTDKAGGMGLGLSISRSLMRAQGGDLRLDATGPAGTRFVVELPIASTARAAA